MPYSSSARGDPSKYTQKQGVCHTMAFPLHIKKYLKEKQELWKLKDFTMPKIYLIFKKSSKTNQNPSGYYNSVKVSTQAQNIIFHKSSYQNISIT
jgi:hypothetical protein